MKRQLLILPILAALAAAAIALSTFSTSAQDDPIQPDESDGPAHGVRLGTFAVDASPPIGSPLAYDPTKGIQTPLSCRGVVLIPGREKPIVLCAVDWIGISSGGQTVFKEAIAAAVGTSTERVVIHALHQHDAPQCDFDAEKLIAEHGASGGGFDPEFARRVAGSAAAAAKNALADSQVITHVGVGEGLVEKVASNRRILGADGKVKVTRYTATKSAEVRSMPVGTIDPQLKLITFWNGEKAVAALSYYATHPQSYYRTGMANPDFPGLARNARQDETGVPHIHFNGAGGNIGAGKWNDGAHANRQVLADRVAAGMRRAWDATRKSPITPAGIGWQLETVSLPAAEHLDAAALEATVARRIATPSARFEAAKKLVWLRRCEAADVIPVGCLTLNGARILHLPGELFVEYQLNAQKLRPDLFVAMAAYGDYAPGYIGTEIAYTQGGYETSDSASLVAPGVENVLVDAIAKLLGVAE